jgi:hypothetical protein
LQPEPATLMGIAMLAVVSYGIVLIGLWRQPRAIKWFAIALVTMGLGYLATTDVPRTLVKSTIGTQR